MAQGLGFARSRAPVHDPAQSAPPPWMAWTVWSVAATFYLAAFYVRTSPAVMTAELMRDFAIAASALGQFSAFYFYAYIAMQIPTGVLVDSWGARRLLVVGAAGAAAGTLLFGVTNSYLVASLGRALVGASTAVGWVVTLKIATHWFPKRRFAMLSGLGLMIGNVGALFAQVPLRVLVEAYGWRAVAVGSAAFMVLLGALAALVVANDPRDRGYRSYAPEAFGGTAGRTIAELVRDFPTIFRYRNTWLIFFAQGGFVGAMLSFTGLWGPAYLRRRFDLSATEAAAICSVMTICWAAASPLAGWASDTIGRRKPIYLGGAIVAAIGWTVLLYTPLTAALFAVVGAVTSFACGAVVVAFAFAKESVPVRFLGTISGAVNVGNMLGPTFLQPAIGWVLDRQWHGAVAGGVRIYGVDAFTTALTMLVAWLLVSCLLIACTTETHCRQTA